MINRKGEVYDMMIFLITVFILAVGLFLMIYIIPHISDGLNVGGLNNSQAGADAIADLNDIGTQTIDNGFGLVFIGLVASLMITSFLVKSSPIFLFMYIFFLMITLVVGIYLGNAYYDMQNLPIFSTIVANAPVMNTIMNHIVEITLAVGALSLVIVFSKFSGSGGPSSQF
jgi:hypothetical protein